MDLTPGRVYRLEELHAFSPTPRSWAAARVACGELVRAFRGAYYVPKASKWGPVPASSGELVRAYLRDSPYLFSGSSAWNALGLGSTAVHAVALVYNTRRTGQCKLGRRRIWFRRVRFPEHPTREWWVIDLIKHRMMAGLDRKTLESQLRRAVARGIFDPEALVGMSRTYGTRDTRAVVAVCVSR